MALAFLILAALGGCFGGYGNVDVRPGDKSPRLAGSLGLVPGLGAGHRYAGARKTANVLFVTEVVGALFIAKAVRDDTPPEFSSEKGWGYAEFGIVMALGSWLCDSFGAPAAARKHNRTRRRFDGIITPVGGAATYSF